MIGSTLYVVENSVWGHDKENHTFTAYSYKIISFNDEIICAAKLKYNELDLYNSCYDEYETKKIPFYDIGWFDRKEENKSFYTSRELMIELIKNQQQTCGCERCVDCLQKGYIQVE